MSERFSMQEYSTERSRMAQFSQYLISVLVTEIHAMQVEQTASRRRLDELFQSMLHRAFQGEL